MTRPALHTVRAHMRKSPKRKSRLDTPVNWRLAKEIGHKFRVKAESRRVGRS